MSSPLSGDDVGCTECGEDRVDLRLHLLEVVVEDALVVGGGDVNDDTIGRPGGGGRVRHRRAGRPLVFQRVVRHPTQSSAMMFAARSAARTALSAASVLTKMVCS